MDLSTGVQEIEMSEDSQDLTDEDSVSDSSDDQELEQAAS